MHDNSRSKSRSCLTQQAGLEATPGGESTSHHLFSGPRVGAIVRASRNFDAAGSTDAQPIPALVLVLLEEGARTILR